MWLVIQSDGDIDYTDVYGPFSSKQEAEDATPEIDEFESDYAYRVVKLKDPSKLKN